MFDHSEKVVFFASDLTVEEEYKILTKRKERVQERIKGNYTLPKQFRGSVSLINNRPVKKDNLVVASLINALLSIDMFSDCISLYCDKTEYSSDLNIINGLRESLRLSKVVSDNKKFDKVCDKFRNSLLGTELNDVYFSLLQTLHKEFKKYLFYENDGWLNEGDKAFDVVDPKYFERSPITIMLVIGLKRKTLNKKFVQQFDMIDVKHSMCDSISSLRGKSGLERPFKDLPKILAFSFDGKCDVVDQVELMNKQIYCFKIAINEDYNVGVCRERCRMAFYIKKDD